MNRPWITPAGAVRLERVWAFLLVSILLVTSLALCVVAAAADPSKPPPDLTEKSILILHSFSYEQRAYMIMDPILVDGLFAAGVDPNRLYFEYMDLARHTDYRYRNRVLRYVERKLERQTLDLIIVLHPDAFWLAIQQNDLFPGVPVINVLADSQFKHPEHRQTQIDRLKESGRSILFMPFSVDAHGTVENILLLQPSTRKLVIISGSAAFDNSMEEAVRSDLLGWKGLEIEYVSDLSVDEFLRCVSSLEPDTAVLYTSILADRTGKIYSPSSVGKMISRAAAAPVFGLFSTLLGDGVVGGTMLHHDSEAHRTVDLAVKILSGENPAEPITILPAPLVPVFDWAELKRWKFSERTLPEGSVVINRPMSLWRYYRQYIVAGILLLVAQSILIVGLLLQRERIKRTERALRRANEELERRNRELEGFTFAAAHDLQEPLRKIQVFGDLIVSKPGEMIGHEDRLYIHRMRETAARMQEVLRGLLRYSSLTSKAEPFRRVDLNLIMRGVLSNCELQIRETQASVEIAELPEIDGDPGQMFQLMQNLLDNALKYRRGQAPSVRVYSECEGAGSRGRWRICVEDNGIGFDEKYLEKIFQPFQRLHGRDEFKGTGIGLAICRKIVERHGGTITARSTPGRGSTFIVTLPVKR